MVEINLLPWRDDYRQQQWKNGCVFYGISLSLVLAILLVIHEWFSFQVNQQQQSYQAKLSELAIHRPVDAIDETEVMWQASVKQQRIIYAVCNCLFYGKSKVVINDFSFKEKNIFIKGYSTTFDDVKELMREILAIHAMDFVKLVSLKQIGQRMEFDLLAVEQ